jgi:hypothetical protein
MIFVASRDDHHDTPETGVRTVADEPSLASGKLPGGAPSMPAEFDPHWAHRLVRQGPCRKQQAAGSRQQAARANVPGPRSRHFVHFTSLTSLQQTSGRASLQDAA